MDSFLLDRLAFLYDPWDHLEFKPARGEIEAARPQPNYEVSVEGRTREYHVGRIRYFMDCLARGEELPPISVDNWCDGGNIYPEPIILDGHHRFCAALLAGAERIAANYGGRIDVKDYLVGKRKTCPQE